MFSTLNTEHNALCSLLLTLMNYKVVVGNIGTVYDGNDEPRALETFEEYRDQSKSGYGRAAAEQVTLLEDGEIVREFTRPCRLPK